MKITVVYHSADYDGIFCREIARKFMPGAELIGWNFGDPRVDLAAHLDTKQWYVLDLPLDKPFGWNLNPAMIADAYRNIVWIDHHNSSIASHPANIPGYRIDGVAACRLAWQWFIYHAMPDIDRPDWLPGKDDFLQRDVSEPLAVRLAGEYDVWDHRGDGDLEFQFGLDAQSEIPWSVLLDDRDGLHRQDSNLMVLERILNDGRSAMSCYAKRDADIVRARSFKVEWEGLTFLCLNTARCNSNSFAALDQAETGHDALLGFFFNGKVWTVSLYHARHRTDLDLSQIAVRHGGGGHKGACGFTSQGFPFAEI